MIQSATKEQNDILCNAALEGHTVLLQTIVKDYHFHFRYLAKAYKIACQRALKLQPRVDVNQLHPDNYQTDNLISQGKKCHECADMLYKKIQHYFLDEKKATQFALILCKINNFMLLYNFNLLYNVNIHYHAQDKHGQTCLHIASKNGNLEIVQFLLDVNVNINIQDFYNKNPTQLNKTALHYAVENYQFDVVNLLLQQHCQIDIYSHEGLTPLHYVSPGPYGHQATFELLLSYGSDINKSCKGRTILYQAVAQNRSEAVAYLLKLGASPFVPSLFFNQNSSNLIKFQASFETPLRLAIKSKYDRFEEEIENIKIITMLTHVMTKK